MAVIEKRRKMEAAMVNPFVEGALYILDTTASVKVLPGKPFLKKKREALGDISGILEISGDLPGSASVSFTEQSILGIVSAMFGEEMTKMDEEITDAVGEICNMISGHVTTKIVEMGKTVKVKLSEVKAGKNHKIDHAHGKRVLVLPFKTTKGSVVVEVSY
ncbi:MAG: chemotaxis protein CheX [Thermodesulfobacteriota bacterium]|nr:chemotaxis protein CheX [Thermodesulfobacteriota bacterium]